MTDGLQREWEFGSTLDALNAGGDSDLTKKSRDIAFACYKIAASEKDEVIFRGRILTATVKASDLINTERHTFIHDAESAVAYFLICFLHCENMIIKELNEVIEHHKGKR